MAKKNKKLLIFTLFTALFSCLVGGVSTFAWFQLDQRPIQSQMVTGTPNLTVGDNIYGYKINQTLGNNGYISSSNDIVKFGKDNSVTGTNHHQDSSDTNFNVPDGGIGYYLVKKNPGGTFKYKYTTDGTNYTSYATKFIQYDATYISRAYIDNFEVSKNDVFRVMKYTFSNSKTVNAQLEINSVYPTDLLSMDDQTTDVTCATAGTYKIWLDYDSGDLSFESTTISSGGIAVRSKTSDEEISRNVSNSHEKTKNSPMKRTPTGSTNVNNIKLWLIDRSNNGNNFTWENGDPKIHFTVSEYADGFEYSTYSDVANAGIGFSLGSDGNSLDTYDNMTWNSADYYLQYDNTSGNFRSYYYNFPWYFKSITFWFVSSNGGYTYDSGSATAGNEYRMAVYNTKYDSGNRGNMYQISSSGSQTISTGTYTITYNLNGGAGTSSNIFYEHQVTSAPSNPTKDGYAFYKWTTTNSKSAGAYEFGSALTADLTLYAQWLNNYTVTLYASYFIDGSQSSYTEYLTSSTVVEGNTYTASGYTDNRDYNDTTNGIHYTFSRVNSSTWYNSAACSSSWTNGSTIDANTKIYAKFNVAFSGNYTTFYIDISDANTNDSDAWSSVSIMNTDGLAVTIAAIKVADNLYRVTLPNTYEFRLGNGITGTPGNQNFTTIIKDYTSEKGDNNLPSANTGKILYVNQCSSNKDHNYQWCNKLATTSYGIATIYTSSDGSSWIEKVRMEIGDATNNYFIYEHGLQIAVNQYINVVVTGSSGTPAIKDYGLISNFYTSGDTKYIDTSGTYIKTANYTGTARFNFYITNNSMLSIAMVPDYGNGFYIMPYNSTFGTNNFIGAIKMTSNSETMASYEYYYAHAGEEIFIRSYLNARDNLINSAGTLNSASTGVYLGTTNGSTPTEDGVLHFTNQGYYNIAVENGKISVKALTELSSSFKLNKLDTDNVDSAYKIWKQKTSLVLEVPFTCVNDYKSSISLNVSNNLSDFVGVSLCVVEGFSSSKSYTTSDYVVYNGSLYKFTSAHAAGAWNSSHVTEESPYTFMRGSLYTTRSTYYNSLSNGSTITDQRNTQIKSANSTDYSYAYILVDYLPTRTNDAGYAYGSTSLAGNSAYSGSICTSNIYSSSTFLTTNKDYTISYVLVATQV